MNKEILPHSKINKTSPKTNYKNKWCLWICNNKKECLIKILVQQCQKTIIWVSGKLGWKQLRNILQNDQWDWMMLVSDFRKK